MSPIEIGRISPVDARVIRTASGQNDKTIKPQAAAPDVVRSDALDAGAPPVDVERVQLIRKAIESGTYPIVPARIADAIIAAGMLLRNA